MTKTTTTARVRQSNLYTIERDGQPVAQAMAISQAEAVRLYVESVQQPTMTARLSSPMEARTLAGLPLLQREPAAVDTKTEDLFGDAPAADHVEDALTMVPPQRAPIEAVTDGLASGAEDPPGELVAGDCAEPAGLPAAPMLVATGRDCPTCRHDSQGSLAGACVPCLAGPDGTAPMWEPVTVQPGEPAEPVALDASAPAVCDPVQIGETSRPSGLPAEFLSYIEGEEPAAEQPGEPAGCLDAAPTAGEPAGASSAVDDDGGQQLTATEQAAYEAQGAARFAQHHGSELKRQAEAATARAGGKVAAKYLNHETGESWSGRGLKPRWLVQALEDGKTLDEFLIDPA